MSRFHKVIADLNISLRNPIDRGDGEKPHCYVRADELAALIQCALAVNTESSFDAAVARKALEECDR